MKRTSISCHALITACVLVLHATAARLQADELSESDKYFLRGYEKMRAALVGDYLAKANEAAQELTESGFQVARAETLGFARDEFTKLSKLAVKIAAGQAGLLHHVLPGAGQGVGPNIEDSFQPLWRERNDHVRRDQTLRFGRRCQL